MRKKRSLIHTVIWIGIVFVLLMVLGARHYSLVQPISYEEHLDDVAVYEMG